MANREQVIECHACFNPAVKFYLLDRDLPLAYCWEHIKNSALFTPITKNEFLTWKIEEKL